MSRQGHFLNYWPFVLRIHGLLLVSQHKRLSMQKYDHFFVVRLDKPLKIYLSGQWNGKSLCSHGVTLMLMLFVTIFFILFNPISNKNAYSYHQYRLSIEDWTKWPTFNRRHFKMHFLEWKYWYFDYNFTEICSLWSNQQYVSTASDDGLVPSGTRPLPEPLLIKIYNAVWHH